MRSKTFRRIFIWLVVAYVAQAVILTVSERKIRLSSEVRRAYIYEGDLVSTTPPKNADEASKTISRDWLMCRYWNGIVIKSFFVPSVSPCPLITP